MLLSHAEYERLAGQELTLGDALHHAAAATIDVDPVALSGEFRGTGP